jgi:hypothetical protein
MWSWFTPFHIHGTILSLNTSGSFIVANVNRELLINALCISHNSLAVNLANVMFSEPVDTSPMIH